MKVHGKIYLKVSFLWPLFLSFFLEWLVAGHKPVKAAKGKEKLSRPELC